MDELTLPAAANLIRAGAKPQFSRSVQASDETIAQIYAVTDGNPLAIKLVVGLTAVLPLPQILSDLVSAKMGKASHRRKRQPAGESVCQFPTV